MNNPNPLLPQGSLQSQSKGKSNFRIAVFTILAIHVVLICGFLIQGCKREPVQTEPVASEPTNQTTETFEPIGSNDTFAPLPTDTNAFATYEPAPGTVSTAAPGIATTGGVSTLPPVTPTNLTPSVPTTEPLLTEPAAPVGETTTHVVAKGEMLSTIARKYKVTVRAIEDANPGVNPTRLQIGQKLTIPASAVAVSSTPSTTASSTEQVTGEATTYTVKSGDVLERIAKNHNTTVSAIKAANALKTDRIKVGQKLKIPSGQ